MELIFNVTTTIVMMLMLASTNSQIEKVCRGLEDLNDQLKDLNERIIRLEGKIK